MPSEERIRWIRRASRGRRAAPSSVDEVRGASGSVVLVGGALASAAAAAAAAGEAMVGCC